MTTTSTSDEKAAEVASILASVLDIFGELRVYQDGTMPYMPIKMKIGTVEKSIKAYIEEQDS